MLTLKAGVCRDKMDQAGSGSDHGFQAVGAGLPPEAPAQERVQPHGDYHKNRPWAMLVLSDGR